MIGQTISQYKIIEKLGEGGMGVVYKAQDTKLDRFVALKFLPPHLAASEQDKARFIQEAKSASALNHPNVCTIHDISEHEGQLFIVMEFVDGKSLKEKKENLSQKQIIEIGIQVAEGLAAAHEKGIVHRDIKPDNIMFRKDGIVQIMDFGLAKLYISGNVSRLTKAGTTMGTMGYMSPEQVQGLDVDHRTDIFSLGVVLYELLAGESPFKGVHETAIMYEIVNVDPAPLSSIKPDISSDIDTVILECLEKDPAERMQSAAEISRNLRRIKRDSGKTSISRKSFVNATQNNDAGISASGNKQTLRQWNRLITIMFIVSILVVAMAASFITWRMFPEPEKEIRKFQWSTNYSMAVLSPDGRKIAYSLGEKLWIRRMDNMDPIEIKNDKIVENLFWSPNSEYLAYFTLGNKSHDLRRVSVNGAGNSLIVTTEENCYPRFWGTDDSILVNTWNNNGWSRLQKVPATGGELKPICGGDSALSMIQGNLQHVDVLPDGSTLLITLNSERIIVQTKENRKVVYVSSNTNRLNGRAVYSPNGYILAPLASRGTDLWALPFDLSSLRTTGNPFLAIRNVSQFSISTSGMLLYLESGNGIKGQQIVVFSRSGQVQKKISQLQTDIHSPSISPDGKLIATTSTVDDGSEYNIWIHDINKGTAYQLSYDIREPWKPSWSPDGKNIIVQSGFFDKSDIYLLPTNGTASARSLIQTPLNETSPEWSPDGRYIVFTQRDSVLHENNIWYCEYGKEHEPKELFDSRFNENYPCLSPNGKFVTYQSDKSGQAEIYVTSFPRADLQWQISFEGGVFPQWVGNEIFFVSPRRNFLMSAKVTTSPVFRSENPERLFSEDSAGLTLQTGYSFKYTVSRDGKNIIGVKNIGSSSQSAMVIVENWFEEFKDKK
ncbi:MAG: protein kinase [Bacteroidota bacterium]|nr:protein kinase [Bacteroidota bacterium]